MGQDKRCPSNSNASRLIFQDHFSFKQKNQNFLFKNKITILYRRQSNSVIGITSKIDSITILNSRNTGKCTSDLRSTVYKQLLYYKLELILSSQQVQKLKRFKAFKIKSKTFAPCSVRRKFFSKRSFVVKLKVLMTKVIINWNTKS